MATPIVRQSTARDGAKAHRRLPGRRLLVIAAFAALIGAPAGPAAAASPDFRLSGHVERISDPSAVANARMIPEAQRLIDIESPTYYAVKGDVIGKGVRFSFDLEATAGVPVAAIEIAHDPTGRQQILAVGRPTPDSLAKLEQMQGSGQASSKTIAREARPEGASTLAIWRETHGFFSTFWTDPIGLTVNSVIDEARWQYNGVNVRSLTGQDLRQWMTANGWREVSHSIGAYYNAGKTVGTVYTNDHFETRSWFPCPHAVDHDTWYQANNVYGFKDGHTGGGVNTWATGVCKGLLSVTAFASPGA